MKKRRILTLFLAGVTAWVCAAAPVSAAEGWQKDARGWWYLDSTGKSCWNEWEYVNGNWYYFDASGYLKKGWLYDQGEWYYLNPEKTADFPEGAMLADTEQVIDGYLYSFDTTGQMHQDTYYYELVPGGMCCRIDQEGHVRKYRTADTHSHGEIPEGWNVYQKEGLGIYDPFLRYSGGEGEGDLLLYPNICQDEVDRQQDPTVAIYLYASPSKPETAQNGGLIDWDSVQEEGKDHIYRLYQTYFSNPAKYQMAYYKDYESFELGRRMVRVEVALQEDYGCVSLVLVCPKEDYAKYAADFRNFVRGVKVYSEQEVLQNKE